MQNYYAPQQGADGSYLTPGREWEIEQVPQPLTVFGIMRGVSRLGLLTSLGLATTLGVRLFPLLIPAYCGVLAIALCGGAIYASLSRSTSVRMYALIIGLCLTVGCIAGSWDAVYAVMTDLSGRQWMWQAAIVGGALVALIAAERIFRGAQD